MNYSIDIKVYEGALFSECPFVLPDYVYDFSPTGRTFHVGYHVIKTNDKNFVDNFDAWASKVSFLKIIGMTSW